MHAEITQWAQHKEKEEEACRSTGDLRPSPGEQDAVGGQQDRERSQKQWQKSLAWGESNPQVQEAPGITRG